MVIFFLVLVNFYLLFLATSKPLSRSNNQIIQTPPTVSGTGNIDIRAVRSKWSAEIDKLGPDKAYQEFKQAYRQDNPGIQHNAAHIFGNLLYEKIGYKGIVVCDSSFAFGCYHSFFSSAISDKGIGILKTLDQECIKKYGPGQLACQHGIGHGLLEYYTTNKLADALKGCAGLSWKGPLFGCQDGVFMEYNFPTIINGQNASTTIRPADMNHLYAPCPTIDSAFRQACYYGLGQWWLRILNNNYTLIGKLCDAVSSTKEKEACFMGVGNVIPPSVNYQVDESKKNCAKMPNTLGQMYCLAAASSSFYASEANRNLGPKLCEGLTTEIKTTCIQNQAPAL